MPPKSKNVKYNKKQYIHDSSSDDDSSDNSLSDDLLFDDESSNDDIINTTTDSRSGDSLDYNNKQTKTTKKSKSNIFLNNNPINNNQKNKTLAKPTKKLQIIKKINNDIENDNNTLLDKKNINNNSKILPKQNIGFGYIKTINERKERGKKQKIFLILTYEYDNKIIERKYDVMGTTGNVYTVIIKNKPTCTCPDFTTRCTKCKHIYFVLTRIMQVKEEAEDVIEYSDNLLINMFKSIPKITENLKVKKSILDRYNLKKDKNGMVPRKIFDEETVCPICLECFLESDEETVYCRYTCGNSIHKNCFNMYLTKKVGCDKKCLYCLSFWEKNTDDMYINLNN